MTPVKVDNVIAVAADNKQVYGLNAADGKMLWMYRAPQAVVGQMRATNKYLVVQLSDNSIQVIDSTNGQAAWENPQRVFRAITGGIGTYSGNVLYMTGDDKLTCKSIALQKTIWETQFTDANVDSNPVVVGDLIYVNNGPYLSVLSATSGRGRWQALFTDRLAFSPAVSAEGIAVVTRTGMLNVVSPTGKKLQKQPVDLGSEPAAEPVWVGKMILVGTTNGAINMIDPSSGATIWSYWIRPITTAKPKSTTSGRGEGLMGAGGMGGGGMAGGGLGGGMSAGGRSGGQGNRTGQSGTEDDKGPLTVPVAGPAVISGNTLLLLAADGSLLAFDKELGVDLTPPTVQLLWPNPGSDISGQPPLELIFKIEDVASGVNEDTIKISVDGQKLNYRFGRDGFAVVGFSDLSVSGLQPDDRYLANKPLNDGPKVITVEVTDYLGNVSKTTYRLVIDNTLKPLTREKKDDTMGGGNKGRGGGAGGGMGGVSG
jgi:outer membrane protein assembly factor BamB